LRRLDSYSLPTRRLARHAAQAADGLRVLRHMTEADLDAIVAYLRTVPAKE
jgi:hypothetical protein